MSLLTIDPKGMDPRNPLAVTVTITNTSVGTGGTSTSTSTGAGTSTSTSTSTGASRGASTSTGTIPGPDSNTGDPGPAASNTFATPGTTQMRPNLPSGDGISTSTNSNTVPAAATAAATGTMPGTTAGTTTGTEFGTAPAQHKDVYPAIDYTALKDSMRGRVALVSGAGNGIGRAIALSFARAGAAGLALLSRTSNELVSLASEISRQYPETKTLVCAVDMMDRVRLVEKFSEIKRILGIVDVLAVDAGMNLIRPFTNTPEEEWWHTMDLNVRGPMLLARLALPGMRERNVGTIIFVSSRLGVESVAGSLAFSVSKTALIRAAACLQLELDADSNGSSGITTYSLNPGDVNSEANLTALHPDVEKMQKGFSDRIRTMYKGYYHTPELCAQTCVYLAKGNAIALRGRYINASDDIEDLVRQSDIIREQNLYDLGVRSLGS